jgi:hypothetical protein
MGCRNMMADGDGRALGDDLGRFSVAARLKTSNCGPQALDTPDDWKFDVFLSHEHSSLYWNTGADAVEGTIAADGKTFSLSSDSIVNVPGEATSKAVCTVTRTDSANGVFDAADGPRAFDGSLAYRFSPDSASDCSELMATAGFEELPCSMSYQMAAEWVSER